MIWTLRIKCVSGRFLSDEWIRVVELDSGSTLWDLNHLILRIIGFDSDHLFEFFGGRSPRNRRLTFGDDMDLEATGVWDEITIEEIFPLPPNHKLYYHFDFGDDWYFQITKSRAKEKSPEAGVAYPRVIQATGPNPPQYGSDFN